MFFSKRKREKLEKNTLSKVLKIAVPSMIESFFVAFIGMIDSFMVSTLGSSKVASVAITNQPKFLGLCVFFTINISVSALVARRYGQKERDKANAILLTGIILVLLLSILIGAFYVVFASDIMKIAGSNSDTHSDSVLYLKIIMGAMVFNCLQMVINAAQRGVGNTKITMRTNVVANIVNVVFNYLLINGNLGFPRLGVKGAAIATVIGTIVACIMSIASILKNVVYINIPYIIQNKILPKLEYLKDMAKLCYSLLIEQLLVRFGLVMTAFMAARQGTYEMAAHQVVMNLLTLTFAFGDGLQGAAVSLVGKSLGEKNKDLAIKYGNYCQRIGMYIGITIVIIYIFISKYIFMAFFREKEIVEICMSLLIPALLTIVFQIPQVVYLGILRAAGDVFYTAVISALSMTILRTFVSWSACYILGFGIVGIWLGILADQIARCSLSALRYKTGKWTKINI